MDVAIVDYGMGNLLSIKRKVKLLGKTCTITNDPQVLSEASKIILPGIGSFQSAMEHLKRLDLIGLLNELVLNKKRPILGICLGMQLLADYSEEGDAVGLGWISGKVVKFSMSDKLKYKVPHIGWNQVKAVGGSELNAGIADNAEYYFVHAYHFHCEDSNNIKGLTNYELEFVSIVQRDNIYGVQYHPEKSHDVGLQQLGNFLNV